MPESSDILVRVQGAFQEHYFCEKFRDRIMFNVKLKDAIFDEFRGCRKYARCRTSKMDAGRDGGGPMTLAQCIAVSMLGSLISVMTDTVLAFLVP